MALADPVQSFNLPSRSARNVAGFVLLIALAAGAASAVWSMATGRGEADAAGWTREDFMQGDVARDLAGRLAGAAVPRTLADAERAVSWLVAGSLGPRVRQGCGQWLFLADELEVHPGGAQNARKRLDALTSMRDLLRRRNIELVVATVPDKSRVQHEQLCNVYRPASLAGRLDDWEKGLEQRGIRHASLLAGLEALAAEGRDQPFLRTDTHWSEAGARASAQAVTRAVRQTGVQPTPVQHYVLAQGKAMPRPGDLVRLAGLDWLPMSLQPRPDMVASTTFTVQAAYGQAQLPADDDADLFGEASLPSLALIGTSYSRTSSFASFLGAALDAPLPSFAQDGGDFWGSAKSYLESGEFRDTPPRLVVWEIPERVIQMPVSPGEDAWMRHLAAL